MSSGVPSQSTSPVELYASTNARYLVAFRPGTLTSEVDEGLARGMHPLSDHLHLPDLSAAQHHPRLHKAVVFGCDLDAVVAQHQVLARRWDIHFLVIHPISLHGEGWAIHLLLPPTQVRKANGSGSGHPVTVVEPARQHIRTVKF